MSGFRFAAALAVLVGTTSYSLAAELPAKWTATVTLEKIEVRAAPALAAPQTTFLKRGEQVAIHHEEGQFYAIIPPTLSVSYVKHLFLGEFDRQRGKNAVIMKDNCPVRVGGEIEVSGEGKEPSMVTDICQVRLPYGSIVEIIGQKYESNNTYWYPIKPPAGEFRYIPKAAVAHLQDVNAPTASVKPNPSGIVTGDPESPASPPSASANAVSVVNGAKVAHPLWGEAELLQSQGRFAEAGKVYVQIYQELKDKRAELEDLLTCLNRIDECKEKAKTPNAASGLPREAPPRSAPPASIETPANYRPSTQPAPPPVRKDWPTSRNEERVESRSSDLTGGSGGKLDSSGPGVLRRAPFFIDNKQAYALQTNNGELLYYVTAQQGVNLDAMISKRVELQGTVKPRGDLRGAPYMVVSKANPAK